MFKIKSRFYIIYGDGHPIYVGYTNRTVKKRFTEHKESKDFSDYKKVQVKELKAERLTYDFTWDYGQTCKNADEVSLREAQLVQKYNTQSSVFQKADGGGQTWASEKWFVKSNRNNPRFTGLSGAQIKRLLKQEKVLHTWLYSFVGNMQPVEKVWLNSFVSHMQPVEQVWLHNFVNHMNPTEKTWLNSFVSSMNPVEKVWLKSFVSNMNPVEKIWLKNFVSSMNPVDKRWLNDFVHNMQPVEKVWLQSFVSNMLPLEKRWLQNFVSSMNPLEKRWLNSFVGDMNPTERVWLKHFVGNMRPPKKRIRKNPNKCWQIMVI